MTELGVDVCIEKTLVALATTPKYCTMSRNIFNVARISTRVCWFISNYAKLHNTRINATREDQSLTEVFSSELLRHFETFLDLCCCVCYDVSIGIGCCSVHVPALLRVFLNKKQTKYLADQVHVYREAGTRVPRVGEQVTRVPEQFYACLLHQLSSQIHHLVQLCIRFF